MEPAESYGLALAFDTDEPEFARGVEIGRLWERLRVERDVVDEVVHLANVEMVLRVAEVFGREVLSQEHDGTWMTVQFSAAQ